MKNTETRQGIYSDREGPDEEERQIRIREELSEEANLAYDGDRPDGDIPRKAEPEDHEYPDVFTMTNYLCCHYKSQIYTYMNQCLRDGTLRTAVGFPFLDTWLTRTSCRLEDFSYYRINRTEFFTDIKVLLTLRTASGTRTWVGTLILWCSFTEEDEDNPYVQLRNPDRRTEGCKSRHGVPDMEDADFAYSIMELVPGTPDRREFVLLSPFLVPYYRAPDMDAVADNIWMRYMPEAIRDPRKRNATELARRMGLRVEYHPVSKHDTVESILFYRDDVLRVHDDGAGAGSPYCTPADIKIHARTIVINTNKLRRDYSSHSIFHECIHFDKHYLFYRLQGLRSNDATKIKTLKKESKKRSEQIEAGKKESGSPQEDDAAAGGGQPMDRHIAKEADNPPPDKNAVPAEKGKGANKKKKPGDPLYFMEWQANRGALALAMPARHTLELIIQGIDRATRDTEAKGKTFLHDGELMEEVGHRLRRELFLPDFRLQTRMVQLGFPEAKGALNYVDKKPIEPFAFRLESLADPAHTFLINQKAMGRLLKDSEEFREIMRSGNYIYADGHIVRNRPQFVTTKIDPRDGEINALTDIARTHLDECCLRFVRVVVQKGIGRYVYGRMYYDADYVIWNKVYLDDFINRENLGDIDEIEARIQYRKKFPDNFRDAFNYLRVARGFSMVKMAKELGMDDQTLRRWLDDPVRYRNEDFLAIVSITLKLPDWISELLFQRASIMLFEENPRHMAIKQVLRVFGTDDVKTANKYLEAHGYKKLSI